MLLKIAIDNTKSCDLASPKDCIESNFIEAALHAAKHSKSSTRADILKDVSEMLNCRSEDLSFLFQKETHANETQIYKLDLPDYRLQSSEIYLEAAE